MSFSKKWVLILRMGKRAIKDTEGNKINSCTSCYVWITFLQGTYQRVVVLCGFWWKMKLYLLVSSIRKIVSSESTCPWTTNFTNPTFYSSLTITYVEKNSLFLSAFGFQSCLFFLISKSAFILSTLQIKIDVYCFCNIAFSNQFRLSDKSLRFQTGE